MITYSYSGSKSLSHIFICAFLSLGWHSCIRWHISIRWDTVFARLPSFNVLSGGERSEPTQGSGWKTSYCRACPYVICRTFITRECERFYGLLCSSWKKARLVIDDENNCRFDVQREEHWIHTRPTRSKTVWERLLELFGD